MTIALLPALVPLAAGGDPSGDMVDIFGRPEFDRSPSWWSRMWSSIGDFFDSLSFGWLGPVGTFVMWVLLIGLVGLVVYALVRNWHRFQLPHRRHRGDDGEVVDVVPITPGTSLDPDALAAEREMFVADRDFKAAILVRYRELVVALMGRRLVSLLPGRTTGELRADVAASAPQLAPTFSHTTDVFELTWYADVPPTAGDFDRFDREVTAMMAWLEPVGAP